ncbi:MAG: HNH endonuclease signature motif containing protein [Corynebacterium glucuronolyticum]|nr:HNH endonuclease signature motif containing protein [Mycobacteriaceae bacterium]MDY5834195.1 HNH endonuclease signature motif containing protein [Corynebacterium glucuronolyticum]
MTTILNAAKAANTGLGIFTEVAAIAAERSDAAAYISESFYYSKTTANKLVIAAKNWSTYPDDKHLAFDVPVPILILISHAMNLLHADEDVEAFREEMLIFADHGNTSWEDVRAHIKKIAGKKQARRVSNSVTFSKTTDITGMQHAHVRLDPELMATFRVTLKNLGEKWTELPQSYRYAEGLRRLLHQGVDKQTEDDPWDRTMTPAFMIPVDGDYIGDGMFATTDGTLLGKEDLADIKLADYGLVSIYDKNGNIGCHYLLENERLASKQLLSAIACDQIFCSHPGCYNLAVYSQGHHSKAHKHGGKTNSDTIIPLCRYHNLKNDDDPDKPKNGRHIRDPETKEAIFLPPDGGPPKRHKNHCREYSGRGLYLRHRAKQRKRKEEATLARRKNRRGKRTPKRRII